MSRNRLTIPWQMKLNQLKFAECLMLFVFFLDSPWSQMPMTPALESGKLEVQNLRSLFPKNTLFTYSVLCITSLRSWQWKKKLVMSKTSLKVICTWAIYRFRQKKPPWRMFKVPLPRRVSLLKGHLKWSFSCQKKLIERYLWTPKNWKPRSSILNFWHP